MFLKHNLPAIIWALVILLLCGIPGKDLPDMSFLDNLSFDKVFHLILFFFLVVLTIRGLKKQTSSFFLEKFAKINALAFATFYGALTEILQGTLFVDRKASIYDFLANFIGSLTGVLMYNLIYKKISSFSKRRTERFDEIIFTDRFKDYGAYRLRKSYNKNMSIAITITVILFLAFFINLYINSIREEIDNNIDDNVVISELMDLPPPETNTPPVPPIPPSSSSPLDDLLDKIKYTAPVIVQDSIEYSDTLNHKKKNPLIVNNDSLNGTSNTNNSLTGNGADVYVIVDEFPKFPGGDEARIKFLQDNVKYPKAASYNGIKGVVYINFIVETDGAMSNIKLLMGIGGGCDEEAMRVARLMPKWTPGKRKGQPVRVYINMPIRFFSPTS